MNEHSLMLKQKVDKRAQLIQTALDLFTTQGLQQTSMAQLSKESGVAVGTMYQHFKSKDELIAGIFLHINEGLGKAIALTAEERLLSLRERFDLALRKGYDFYTSNPNQFFFHDTHNYSPLISQDLRDESRASYQQFFDLLNEGIEAEIFHDEQPVLLIRFIYNAMISLVQIQVNHEFEVTDKMIERVQNMIWNGLTI